MRIALNADAALRRAAPELLPPMVDERVSSIAKRVGLSIVAHKLLTLLG